MSLFTRRRVASVVVIGGLLLSGALRYSTTAPESLPPAPTTTHRTIGVDADPVPATNVALAEPEQSAAKAPLDVRATFATMERSRDLFALYHALASSKSSADLSIARRILGECLQISRWNSVYRGIAEGSMTRVANLPEVDESQKAAAREMVSRCAGFNGWQRGAFRSESSVLALKEAGASDDDAETLLAIERQETPSDAMLRRTLAARNRYVISRLEAILPARWLAVSGIAPSPQDETAALFAFRQMVCAIGSDCSPDSLLALTRCVFQAAACGMTFEAQLRSALDEVEATKAGDHRVRMTTAVRDADFAAFGL